MAALSPVGWPAAAAEPGRSSSSPRKLGHMVSLAPFKAISGASSSSFFRLSASPGGLFIQAGATGLNPDGDDGYGGEFVEMDGDEDDEQENNGSGKEERIEAGYNAQHLASESEQLRHEVCMLLNPEERAILEQNQAPNLSKISTSKWRPFHTRAISGQIPFMGVLLQNHVDIDAVDKDGLTALHRAIIGKKEAVISHLLRRKANPHVRDGNGAAPLHHAVQVGALQTVKLLIKYKVDVNAADHEGWTPLHLAIQGRSREIAKVLLINGADKSRKNKDGKTPLDLAFCYGKDFRSFELAKLLKLVPANREL